MQSLRAPIGMALRLDGRNELVETVATRGGGNVVVVETALPGEGLGLTLTSAYLSVPGAQTLVTHGLALAESQARTWSRKLDERQLAATSSQQAFVLDHLAQLQDRLTELGHSANISLADEL